MVHFTALVYLIDFEASSTPATFAPSECIQSCTARILSHHHVSFKEEVDGHMLLIKENQRLLHKHYCQLVKKRKNTLALFGGFGF